VLPSEEYRPCNPTGIFALQEQTLGLAILESKDFVVTADVELALGSVRRMLVHVHSHCQTARGANLVQTLPGYIFWPLKLSS
jgi:hypothetical protein